MHVLLTGASGFVGSHLLDQLMEQDVPTTLLLRATSSRRFLQSHLDRVRVVEGSLADGTAIRRALEGVTHVIHCAGATKAVRPSGLFAANQQGTRNLVQAINEREKDVECLVHVSSLAAGHPATAERPAREDDPPAPCSVYGASKLAAEREVREGCERPWVILRPAAVYGPRDREFLPLFRLASRGWAPVFGGGRQQLSLVYVKDLAQTVWNALTQDAVRGETLHVAAPGPVTTRELVLAIGDALGRRVRCVALPWLVLRAAAVGQGIAGRLTGRAGILTHGKLREVQAPGWVADTSRLRARLGEVCRTPLGAGLRETARWYAAAGWLRPPGEVNRRTTR